MKKKIDISTHSWLYDDIDGLKEKITFRNRTEYRINGKLHNPVGPSIINRYDPLTLETPSDDMIEEYYIFGNKLQIDDWQIFNREHKLKKLLKKTKKGS